jgi:MFS superfamily sulfate permease-like transporter
MSISNPNLPKLVVSLRQYGTQMFLHDLLAGITVGLVALPLAMAFGIASGVTPQAFAKRLTQSGRTLLLCGAMEQPSKLLQQPRFLDHVGRENIMPNIQAALDRAKEIYERQAVLAS